MVSWTIGTSPLAELVKYYSPKAQVTSRPEAGPAGFVHVAENRPAGASGPRFRINYHGAEIETDGKRLHNRFHKTNSKRLRQTVFLLDETKDEVAS